MKASDLTTLKAAIKAEMLRRNGFGSLAEFGGTTYDFTVAPAVGVKTKPEHGQKTIDLLLKIEDYGNLVLVKENDPIPSDFNASLVNEVTRLASEAKTGESASTVTNLFPDRTAETSSCRGACTGLCVGSCHGNCNGCTGCTASCGTGCAGGCNTSCNTGCNDTCLGSCTGNCTGSCYTGCSTGCQTACKGSTKAQGK